MPLLGSIKLFEFLLTSPSSCDILLYGSWCNSLRSLTVLVASATISVCWILIFHMRKNAPFIHFLPIPLSYPLL